MAAPSKHSLLFGLAASCLALAPGIALGQQSPANRAPIPSSAPFERPAPAGQMIDLGGRKLHIRCTGPVGGPTVVVEAALATWSSHYTAMQDAVAKFARICTYDRAGLGWSDPAPAGRTFQDMSNDLARLLSAAKVDRPYILVGHSLGGLITRIYAREHKRDVAAVVLVESSNETINFTPAYAASRTQRIAMVDAGLKVGKPGVPVLPMPPGASTEAIMAMLPEILQTTKDELGAFERVPAEMRTADGFGSLDKTPLVVIRRGRTTQPPNPGDAEWQQSQEELLKLSANSRMVVAEKSGHMVLVDEPQLVADEIRRVLETLSRQKGHVASDAAALANAAASRSRFQREIEAMALAAPSGAASASLQPRVRGPSREATITISGRSDGATLSEALTGTAWDAASAAGSSIVCEQAASSATMATAKVATVPVVCV